MTGGSTGVRRGHADKRGVLLVIPTLGTRMSTLARTLESVASQAGVKVDVLLVCPKVDVELHGLAEACGAGILVVPGHISAAVNHGWSRAQDSHRYLAWLGDDDVLRENALQRAVAALEAEPEAVLAFGNCDYIDDSGKLLFTRRPPRAAAWLLQFVPGLIKQEACLFRRESVMQAGALDEQLRYAMDLDLLLRLRRSGPFARIDAVQAGFCWHADSLTIANREASLTEAQAIQLRNGSGILKPVLKLAQLILRLLILFVSKRINQKIRMR